MSSMDEFDDSLDDILANMTTSQIDPSLKRQRDNIQKFKSCETQTDFDSDLEPLLECSPKRKLVFIQTDKHHHKPCVYHSDSTSETTEPANKRLRLDVSQINGSDSNDSSNLNNQNQLETIDISTESKSSSQLVFISKEEFDNWSQSGTDVINQPLEDSSLQNPFLDDSFDLFESWDSDSDSNDKSIDSIPETDDELILQRSSLVPLTANSNNERSVFMASQQQLFSEEEFKQFNELFKTQMSQNSNSSQNSSVLSF